MLHIWLSAKKKKKKRETRSEKIMKIRPIGKISIFQGMPVGVE